MGDIPEEPIDDERPPDAHEVLYNDMRARMAINDALYEYLSNRVRDCLPDAQAQEVEDALNLSCVSLGSKPLDALILIHTFLDSWQSIVRSRKASE